MADSAAVASARRGLETVRIEPGSGVALLGLGELWRYRLLLGQLTLRALRGRYRPTWLGRSWILLRPALLCAVYVLVFGVLLGVKTDPVPFPLFVFSGIGLFWFLRSAISEAAFTTVSIQTTTGYVTADYETWPSLSKFVLLLAMFLGGMSGSTGGGMKIARVIIAFRAAGRSLKRIGHSRSVMPLRVGNIVFTDDIVKSVLSFIFAYISIFLIGTFLMTLTGLDAVSAISSVAATLGNVGPGLGAVGPTSNYASVLPVGKVILSILMWLGRLELLAVAVLFVPATYRL